MGDLPPLVSDDEDEELESLDGDINPHDLAPYNYPGESDDGSDTDSDEYDSDTDSDEGFNDEYDYYQYEQDVTPPSGVPELDRIDTIDSPAAVAVEWPVSIEEFFEDAIIEEVGDLPQRVNDNEAGNSDDGINCRDTSEDTTPSWVQKFNRMKAEDIISDEDIHLGADGRDHGVIPLGYDHRDHGVIPPDHGDHGAIPPSLDDECYDDLDKQCLKLPTLGIEYVGDQYDSSVDDEECDLLDIEESSHKEAPPNDDEELKSDIDSTQSFSAAELEFAVIEGAAVIGSREQQWTSTGQCTSKEPAEIADTIIAKHISISASHTGRYASLGVQPSELAQNWDSWWRRTKAWMRVKPWMGEHRTNKDLKTYWDIHQKLKLNGLSTLDYRLDRALRLRPGENYNRMFVPLDTNLFIDHVFRWSYSHRSAERNGQNGTLVHCPEHFYMPRMIDVINHKMTLKQDELLVLQSYEFTLAHRAGRGNYEADCLSRGSHYSLVFQACRAMPVSNQTQLMKREKKQSPQMADLVSQQTIRPVKRKPSDSLAPDEVKSRKTRGE